MMVTMNFNLVRSSLYPRGLINRLICQPVPNECLMLIRNWSMNIFVLKATLEWCVFGEKFSILRHAHFIQSERKKKNTCDKYQI